MDLSILLEAVAVVFIPAVLWAVPRFRRRGGVFLTPAKSVPCGCLPLILLPELLWGVWRRCFGADYDRYLFPVTGAILLVTVPVAVAAFRFVDRRQRKMLEGVSNPGRESEPLMYVIVFFFFALLGFGGCVVGTAADVARTMTAAQMDYRGDWRYTALLREDGMKIDFGSQSIHPFLAEYNYRLRFDDGKRVSTHYLHTNCGGRTFFNVYRLPDGRLHLADKDGEYLVDPKTRSVLKLIRKGKIHTVPYPDELVTSGSGPYEENGKRYCEFNDRRVEATPADGILDGEVYYGRITRYFDDARKAPEVPLERYREVR